MTSTTTLFTAALALTLLGGGAALAGEPKGHDHGAAEQKVAPTPAAKEHDHAHAGPGLATAQLKLNAGKKWATDAALRKGMSALRAEVEAAITPIHGGKYTAADFEKLATSLEGKVKGIIDTCKLPPDADMQLHLVVADVFAGTEAMKAAGDRTAGVVRIINALDAYGQFFDQPGWTKIAH